MDSKSSARIAEQAAEYLARRAPSGDVPRKDGLELWLQGDPARARAYAQTHALWNQLATLKDDADLRALHAADLAAHRRGRGRWLRPLRLLAAAAVLMVIVGGGLLALRLLTPPPPLDYATAFGERRTERLPDGTQLVLNTDTAVQARYSRSRREIDLQRGEAQFQVAHDAARPFVVHAGQDTITALGTRFQVLREPGGQGAAGDVVVTLLEGSVEVAHGAQKFTLQPHQQARLTAGDGFTVRPIAPDLATDWLEGWLRFRETPLREVLAEANRYATRKLRLGDPALAEVRLSGSFRAGDNASIASAAGLILPVRVDDSGQDIVLLPE